MLGVYDYTVVLTYISLAVSVVGMINCMNGNLRISILLLAVSGLCDMFDGKIARTKKNRTDIEKRFGIQIDSLCDVICFGMFPILICYQLGMRNIFEMIILCLYAVASVIRLAWYNVMEEIRQNEEEDVRHFYQGLPITSMAVILPFFYLIRKPLGVHFVYILSVAVVIVGILFISNIRVKKPQNPILILMVAMIAMALAKMFHLI